MLRFLMFRNLSLPPHNNKGRTEYILPAARREWNIIKGGMASQNGQSDKKRRNTCRI